MMARARQEMEDGLCRGWVMMMMIMVMNNK